jgi:hypothetical protein
VRTRSHYERDRTQIPGSVRVPTDRIEDWAKRLIAESPDGEPFLCFAGLLCLPEAGLEPTLPEGNRILSLRHYVLPCSSL